MAGLAAVLMVSGKMVSGEALIALRVETGCRLGFCQQGKDGCCYHGIGWSSDCVRVTMAVLVMV